MQELGGKMQNWKIENCIHCMGADLFPLDCFFRIAVGDNFVSSSKSYHQEW